MGSEHSTQSVSWSFPIVPRAQNSLMRQHWSKQRAWQKIWNFAVAGIARRPKESVGLSRVKLTIVVHRPRLHDPDNLVASVKPIVDAFRRHGWCYDDRPAYLDLEVRQVKAPRKDQKTEVLWSLA